ncbi:M15 family metallopeptidase [Streptomyces sp. ME02-6987-2C]|uniref:M15 family metallopeptidase n=1 Tax=unclassified Streptomyces TaxID=2593676 RepID=UPI0029A4A76B|nr:MULTISPECIES: M15 family metallopeptidase [unclassified Streptomyces]MDX3367596.1 M15 family metallopeptidase [Streptomyces sp. ME02-6987-2C]MDX3425793.1 M15 family metallopeptidase [Streptomyces sp. ME02-6985-2c]
MITSLVRGHRGVSSCYYLDVPLGATLVRHASKADAAYLAQVTDSHLASWYRELDLLPGALETVIPADSTLQDTVARILRETGLAPASPVPPPQCTSSQGASMNPLVLMSNPRVAAIPVRECGEPLVDVRDRGFRADPRKQDPLGAFTHVREGVLALLDHARSLLPAGTDLLFIEGYRPLALQRRYFSEYRDEPAAAHPDWTAERLHQAASRYVSPPEIAPHSAGAAVDVTLVDQDGHELDLGTRVNASPEESHGACFTHATNISDRARHHRTLLFNAMQNAGFTNYGTEFWHFDAVRWLLPDDLTLPLHAGLWQCLTTLARRGEPIDPVTVLWEAQQRGLLDDGSEPGKVLRMLAEPAGSVGHWAERALQRSLLATAEHTGRRIETYAGDPANTPYQLVVGARRVLADIAWVTADSAYGSHQ